MTEKLLTGVGVWSAELRYGDRSAISAAATELESLGYTALWVPDMDDQPLFEALDLLLAATSTIVVATGILSIFRHTPQEVAQWWNGLPEEHQARLLLGLGVSHALVVGDSWRRPLAAMTSYLDALEATGVPLNQVCLAALGPRMLELARRRTAGAHPYFVPTEHTAIAREALGDSLLAVEQGVVLEETKGAGHELARTFVTGYGAPPNYANNWKRLGFSDDDIASGSDALVDVLVASGDEGVIRRRIEEQQRAGANHVCIQVITPPGSPLPLDAWRRLAPR